MEGASFNKPLSVTGSDSGLFKYLSEAIATLLHITMNSLSFRCSANVLCKLMQSLCCVVNYHIASFVWRSKYSRLSYRDTCDESMIICIHLRCCNRTEKNNTIFCNSRSYKTHMFHCLFLTRLNDD